MRTTVSRWGNSLAVRIPADVARLLSIEEGSVVDCRPTSTGTLELLPVGQKARAEWLRTHFAAVNARLSEQPITTPASELLDGEDRY